MNRIIEGKKQAIETATQKITLAESKRTHALSDPDITPKKKRAIDNTYDSTVELLMFRITAAEQAIVIEETLIEEKEKRTFEKEKKKLLMEKSKLAIKQKNEEEIEEEFDLLSEQFDNFIIESEMIYVDTLGKFYSPKQQHQYSKTDITNKFPHMIDIKRMTNWQMEMLIDGNHYTKLVQDVSGNCPENHYNLIDTSAFLKPTTDEYTGHHTFFDDVLHCVSDGDKNNIEYLERWIYWKITHPADQHLPAILIYDRNGGSGKGALVTRILRTIFGGSPSSCDTIPASTIVGSFNKKMQGLVICALNEIPNDADYVTKLCNIIGEETININEKNVKAYDVANISGWFLFGNVESGKPMKLSGGLKRRLSVFFTNLTLRDHCVDAYGVTKSNFTTWFDATVNPILQSRSECQQFINYLHYKYSEIEYTPSPGFGNAFDDLVEASKSTMQLFCDDMPHKNVLVSALYNQYHTFCDDENVPKNLRTTKSNFVLNLKNISGASGFSYHEKMYQHIDGSYKRKSIAALNFIDTEQKPDASVCGITNEKLISYYFKKPNN